MGCGGSKPKKSKDTENKTPAQNKEADSTPVKAEETPIVEKKQDPASEPVVQENKVEDAQQKEVVETQQLQKQDPTPEEVNVVVQEKPLDDSPAAKPQDIGEVFVEAKKEADVEIDLADKSKADEANAQGGGQEEPPKSDQQAAEGTEIALKQAAECDSLIHEATPVEKDVRISDFKAVDDPQMENSANLKIQMPQEVEAQTPQEQEQEQENRSLSEMEAPPDEMSDEEEDMNLDGGDADVVGELPGHEQYDPIEVQEQQSKSLNPFLPAVPEEDADPDQSNVIDQSNNRFVVLKQSMYAKDTFIQMEGESMFVGDEINMHSNEKHHKIPRISGPGSPRAGRQTKKKMF